MAVKLGIEALLTDQHRLLDDARVGAVVHPASVLPDLRHTVDVLAGSTRFKLVSLFGPQHGARGEKQDNMIESDFYCDPGTGLPVHSLYGRTRWPEAAMLTGLDVLLFDLQDVGTRVYTFIHTMAYCMQACAQLQKRMVVADRPNPVGGVQVEGNLLDPAFRSFVGLHPIPMRHGMTVGELALLLNKEFGIGCDLEVVPMGGWRRSMWFDQTGLPWVQPSPNLPTLESAVVYPGMVLVEGTTLSEGRGTTRPFEYVGAPYIRPAELASRLNSVGLPGVTFRPAYFEPTFQKWGGVMCGGVQLHVRDRNSFEPYLTGITTISTIKAMCPDSFGWRQPPYEYEYEKLPIEILCGGRTVPDLMERGAGIQEIRESWRGDVAAFRKQRESYLLYGE